MMKKIIFIMILLFLGVNVGAAEKFAFLKSDWSSTRGEIMGLYYTPSVRNNDYLTYNIHSILGMEAQINYGFTKDGELAFQSYRLYTKPSIAVVHIDNYEMVKQNIKTRYGMPASDNIYWADNKDVPEVAREIGETLGLRSMRFVTIWQLPDAKLEIDMKGQGQEVVISVMYTSNLFGKKFFKGIQYR